MSNFNSGAGLPCSPSHQAMMSAHPLFINPHHQHLAHPININPNLISSNSSPNSRSSSPTLKDLHISNQHHNAVLRSASLGNSSPISTGGGGTPPTAIASKNPPPLAPIAASGNPGITSLTGDSLESQIINGTVPNSNFVVEETKPVKQAALYRSASTGAIDHGKRQHELQRNFKVKITNKSSQKPVKLDPQLLQDKISMNDDLEAEERYKYLEQASVSELKEILKAKGLPAAGKKPALLERLMTPPGKQRITPLTISESPSSSPTNSPRVRSGSNSSPRFAPYNSETLSPRAMSQLSISSPKITGSSGKMVRASSGLFQSTTAAEVRSEREKSLPLDSSSSSSLSSPLAGSDMVQLDPSSITKTLAQPVIAASTFQPLQFFPGGVSSSEDYFNQQRMDYFGGGGEQPATTNVQILSNDLLSSTSLFQSPGSSAAATSAAAAAAANTTTNQPSLLSSSIAAAMSSQQHLQHLLQLQQQLQQQQQLLQQHQQLQHQQQLHQHQQQQQQQHSSTFTSHFSDQFSLNFMNFGDTTPTSQFSHHHTNSSSSNTPSPSPSPTHQGMGGVTVDPGYFPNDAVIGGPNFMVPSLSMEQLQAYSTGDLTSPIFLQRLAQQQDNEEREKSNNGGEEPGLVIFKKDNVDFRLPSHGGGVGAATEFDDGIKIMGNGNVDMGFSATLPYQSFVYDPYSN